MGVARGHAGRTGPPELVYEANLVSYRVNILHAVIYSSLFTTYYGIAQANKTSNNTTN